MCDIKKTNVVLPRWKTKRIFLELDLIDLFFTLNEFKKRKTSGNLVINWCIAYQQNYYLK